MAQADKVFVTTASGSENTLTNGGEYIAIDENNIDAVIFSKSDLTVNGEGTLTIEAKAGHGMVSKDDLALTSGTYTITAEGQGLSGKNSVRIADGTYQITAGKDAVHAENTEDATKGFIYIAGGTFAAQADGDGISASAYIQIDAGDFSITTGEGSASVETEHMSDPRQQEQTETEDTDSTSQKGIKSGTALTINGGTVTIVSDGDCLDSNGALTIAGGTLHLTCNGNGNTALDCDGTYTTTGGSITTNDGSEENPNEMGGGGQGAPDKQNGQGGPNGGTPPSNGQTPQKDGETA